MRFSHLFSVAAISALLVAASGCANEPPPVSEKVQAYYESHKAVPNDAAPEQATYEQIKPRLMDAVQPFSIAIIGDSTGNEAGEWVDLAMRKVAAATGRPLIINTWDLTANAYLPAVTVTEGAGTPLTVWNGSASGKSGIYSMENYDTLVPSVVDFAIINHGHNITVPAMTEQQIGGLIQRIRMRSEYTTAIAVTLQNPQSGENRDRNEQVVERLKAMTEADKSLLKIDIHTAFSADGNLAETLRPDGLHPSEKGSIIWADTALAALGF